jgi:hypothetical protein
MLLEQQSRYSLIPKNSDVKSEGMCASTGFMNRGLCKNTDRQIG